MSYAQKLDQKSVYFVTEKFTILDTEPLELAISSCKDLPISKCLQTDTIVYLLGQMKVTSVL